jgi:predicted DNA repair protein MutK
MAGASLLALIDDIASVLDDVALMTKVAAKKTAGVLGDDLALNAQQVAGVRAERELPVVWAVGVGSLKNKVILVPAALAISAFIPWAVTPLLMIGGLYLCFEGVEKLAHRWLHGAGEGEAEHAGELAALADGTVDLVAFEADKIKGAIRTDFVLSAEIIVIALGTVADKPFALQVAVLSGIGLVMTIGVYGIVAGIVKAGRGVLARLLRHAFPGTQRLQPGGAQCCSRLRSGGLRSSGYRRQQPGRSGPVDHRSTCCRQRCSSAHPRGTHGKGYAL